MLRGLIGKKLGMTQVFSREGKFLPVTVLEVGPCVITQIKMKETDGYDAIQMGYGYKKPKNINKPLAGHYAKSGGGSFGLLKEFSTDAPSDYTLGQEITLDMFNIGEKN
jgi:large subunit ribosomal protein L3